MSDPVSLPERPRAKALSRDERRAALVAATVPLLRCHGRAVTTRDIAAAAGIAEGTIFRVFDTKDDLVDAALAAAFDPWPLVARVRAVDPDLALEPRLLALVTAIQERFLEIFDLMAAVGMIHPPDTDDAATSAWRAALAAAMRDLVGPDAAALRVDLDDALHVVRLLTFSASHPGIADGRLLTPAEIVDVLLHGLLRKDR